MRKDLIQLPVLRPFVEKDIEEMINDEAKVWASDKLDFKSSFKNV